jgi:hypothetical protein
MFVPIFSAKGVYFSYLGKFFLEVFKNGRGPEKIHKQESFFLRNVSEKQTVKISGKAVKILGSSF